MEKIFLNLTMRMKNGKQLGKCNREDPDTQLDTSKLIRRPCVGLGRETFVRELGMERKSSLCVFYIIRYNKIILANQKEHGCTSSVYKGCKSEFQYFSSYKAPRKPEFSS